MSAIISECGLYRYTLERPLGAGPTVLWVMLNPSTADADTDDPTIKQCIKFSKREGFGHMIVENLFAYRSTDPGAMLRLPADVARGPKNFLLTLDSAYRADKVICAWGNPGGSYVPQVLEGLKLWCLGRNKNGSPKHPLYLKASTPLVPFGQNL